MKNYDICLTLIINKPKLTIILFKLKNKYNKSYLCFLIKYLCFQL